jgi:DNA-binding PadR family transcriptional regulator
MKKAARARATNPLALAVLASLMERPMHPYEIASTLKERGKDQSIKLNFGSLYTVVASLEQAVLIAPKETLRDNNRPERTVYELTQVGRETLQRWMRELLSVPTKEYSQFEGALSLLPVLAPVEVASLLRERTWRLNEGIAELRRGLAEASKMGVERLFLIEVEYALFIKEAELRWVDSLQSLIDGSPEFVKTWLSFHAPSGATAASMAAPTTPTGKQKKASPPKAREVAPSVARPRRSKARVVPRRPKT